MNNVINTTNQTFESIKKVDTKGNEYWSARELGPLLEYNQWRSLLPVIEKAKKSCTQSGYVFSEHFAEVHKIANTGDSETPKDIKDFHLSRYACYLIVQNGNPSKSAIASGQTYFAVQTRRQELHEEELNLLSENANRVALRSELTKHNKALNTVAKRAGVVTGRDYAAFQDHGYQGLYGGLSAKEIHAKKELKKSQKILDHMGSTELAANLFRATQAQEKLKRENATSKTQANKTHYEVGLKVRKTIKELGGTMPEELPKPLKSVKQLKEKKLIT